MAEFSVLAPDSSVRMMSPITISGTSIARAVSLRRTFLGPIACVVYVILIAICAFIAMQTEDPLLIIAITTVLLFTLWILHSYIREVLMSLPLSTNNIAEWISDDVIEKLPKSAATSNDLLIASLATLRGKHMIELLDVRSDELYAACNAVAEKISAEDLLKGAKQLASDLGEDRISAIAILLVFLHMDGEPQALLNKLDLSSQDVSAIALWCMLEQELMNHDPAFSPPWFLKTFGAIGRTSLAGYTTTLDLFTQDLTSSVVASTTPRIILHQPELEKAFNTLNGSQPHHVLLVGDEGIGKKTFIGNIAARIHGEEQRNAKPFTRILRLNTELLVSGTQNPDAILLHSLDRASKKEKFLFILSDVGVLLKSADEKFVAVLTRLLTQPSIRVIGIIDDDDYHALVKNNPALDQQWTAIELKEPTMSDTIAVMMEAFVRASALKNFSLTYKALKAVVNLTSRYLNKASQPGKSIRVLIEGIRFARRHGEKHLTEEHIREVIASLVPVDLVTSSTHASRAVSSLSENVSAEIIGQEHAVSAVTQALKRAQTDVGTGRGPLAAFLFVGSTGVGKTELAKSVARHLFGSDDALIRVNMNDFSQADSVNSVIGGGEAGESYLLRKVQEHPFSVILLDEIEKAHVSVQHLFLQALDEGMLIDARGHHTDFRNTVMIATSNAAADEIASAADQFTGDAQAWRHIVMDKLLEAHAFSPEFLNRFTEVIAFMPLTHEQATRIARRMVAIVAGDLMKQRGITLVVPDEAFARIVERGFSPQFGAREMRRAITEIVENAIAEALLKGVQRGGEIRIS